MKYTNSYNVSINVTPFFDNGCTLNYLQMYEEIGGSLAGGMMELMVSEVKGELITDQYTGHITLEKKEGNVYEIDFFIVYREYLNNTLKLEFKCVNNKEFFTISKTTTWDDITGAIQSLYPGKSELRCESDVNNGVEFYQHQETNLEFLNRLCSSFKHDVVYSFGWEGLMIKDTIGKDHNGKDEPYSILLGNQEVFQMDSYNFKYDRNLYEEPINPWEELETDTETLPDRTTLESLNCCSLRRYDNYKIVGRDYYQAIQNRQFNLRYLNSNIFTSFRILDQGMPNWKIGDVIMYKRRYNTNTDYPFDTFLIKSNEVFYAPDTSDYTDSNGYKFSWTTKLIGLKQSGIDLDRNDPTDNKKEN